MPIMALEVHYHVDPWPVLAVVQGQILPPCNFYLNSDSLGTERWQNMCGLQFELPHLLRGVFLNFSKLQFPHYKMGKVFTSQGDGESQLEKTKTNPNTEPGAEELLSVLNPTLPPPP